MNSIIELRELFQKYNLVITESLGWYLICYRDTWTMALGVYYKNGQPVTHKDIVEYAKNPPKVKYSHTKMIRAKDFFQQDDEV